MMPNLFRQSLLFLASATLFVELSIYGTVLPGETIYSVVMACDLRDGLVFTNDVVTIDNCLSRCTKNSDVKMLMITSEQSNMKSLLDDVVSRDARFGTRTESLLNFNGYLTRYGVVRFVVRTNDPNIERYKRELQLTSQMFGLYKVDADFAMSTNVFSYLNEHVITNRYPTSVIRGISNRAINDVIFLVTNNYSRSSYGVDNSAVAMRKSKVLSVNVLCVDTLFNKYIDDSNVAVKENLMVNSGLFFMDHDDSVVALESPNRGFACWKYTAKDRSTLHVETSDDVFVCRALTNNVPYVVVTNVTIHLNQGETMYIVGETKFRTID